MAPSNLSILGKHDTFKFQWSLRFNVAFETAYNEYGELACPPPTDVPKIP